MGRRVGSVLSRLNKGHSYPLPILKEEEIELEILHYNDSK